uniref:Uncharacterized protein n=1 Tax=Octopus bimaculoides TaxID=37653 RepID=A0A0L8HJT2_OCTBM
MMIISLIVCKCIIESFLSSQFVLINIYYTCTTYSVNVGKYRQLLDGKKSLQEIKKKKTGTKVSMTK